jgi:hypothetical protein
MRVIQLELFDLRAFKPVKTAYASNQNQVADEPVEMHVNTQRG